MTRVNAADARNEFGATLDRVARKRERIVLQRRGKDVAAIIPLEDLELLERLAREEEDRQDAAEARKRLAEMEATGEKPVSWEQVKRENGL